MDSVVESVVYFSDRKSTHFFESVEVAKDTLESHHEIQSWSSETVRVHEGFAPNNELVARLEEWSVDDGDEYEPEIGE